MAVSQTYTCDCCNGVVGSNTVLDVIMVTYLDVTGTVIQNHYGRVCGCSDAILAAVEHEQANHANHHPPTPPEQALLTEEYIPPIPTVGYSEPVTTTPPQVQ